MRAATGPSMSEDHMGVTPAEDVDAIMPVMRPKQQPFSDHTRRRYFSRTIQTVAQETAEALVFQQVIIA